MNVIEKFILGLSFVKGQEKELNTVILELKKKLVLEDTLKAIALQDSTQKLVTSETRCVQLAEELSQVRGDHGHLQETLTLTKEALERMDKRVVEREARIEELNKELASAGAEYQALKATPVKETDYTRELKKRNAVQGATIEKLTAEIAEMKRGKKK